MASPVTHYGVGYTACQSADFNRYRRNIKKPGRCANSTPATTKLTKRAHGGVILHTCIIPHKFPEVRPRLSKAQPDTFDPLRRLAAAVALQAIIDVLYPSQSTTVAEQFDARQFTQSDDGQYILAKFIGEKKAGLFRDVILFIQSDDGYYTLTQIVGPKNADLLQEMILC